MDLPAWMAREGLNLTAAADRLQLPVPTLHNYLGGYRRPSLDRARDIVARTQGAVTLAELLPEVAAAFGLTSPCPAEVDGSPGTVPVALETPR